ncbi:MAG: hypothetical protein LHW64_07900 [Candidatus Cloacimonetes bacterium]|jgi:hypothetical protein|nr:hypothetical protein [Candidatus Cloacimonadota bacterium]MCB5287713.1 hypothetical protein [Candidatus Cloacimonadota bacterium]MCK9183985.1 hypothetical protein [Candidatus Cloacimonadota bacterium]MCK9583857.1 hypothetical protein [Candidatus Cloacimonadota bacterium]MDY0230034.1 hypothetical protein [Candidatus Cloacimonadaceae bacterium]
MHEILLEYLNKHGKSPVDYVLSKFEPYDIVLLGEMHRVGQQLALYHKLIPRLAEHGIGTIAYEFARREDQGLVDELLDKSDFDVPLAKKIMIKQEAYWGYQEYLDVFRLVWSVNKELPASQKIRILGLNDPINWKLYTQICQRENRHPSTEERAVIWKGCGERYWADIISEHYEPNHTKILGIMGSHHAFTKYREPAWRLEGDQKVFTGFEMVRFGNHLQQRYGEKLFNICFYDPWDGKRAAQEALHPAGGIIEQVISPHYEELGFDLQDSPMGELKDDSFYSLGYPDFRLKDNFDGMIYTGRLRDLQPMTPIADFIDEENISLFRDYVCYNYDAETSIAELNAIIHEDAKI